MISSLEYGSPLTVRYNGGDYEAKICYIDVKTQYAPRDLQTEANRAKKSFKVKLELPEECAIRPGETAKVIVR